MRRFGVVLMSVLVLLAAFSQLVLPGLMENRLGSLIQKETQAEAVNVDLQSMPGVLLLAGQADRIDITADKAWLGDIQVEKLTLHGENVQVDFSALDKRDGSAIRSSDRLELTGSITSQALQEMLEKKLDKVENLSASMDRDKLTASGQVKLIGRMADIHLEGRVLARDGGLYFHMTQLDIKNAVFGQAVLGNFFGEILLFDLYNSPVRAEIDDVEQHDGYVVIKAVAANQAAAGK